MKIDAGVEGMLSFCLSYLKVSNVVLLMEGICELRRWNGLR
jgi:hypothetical protein